MLMNIWGLFVPVRDTTMIFCSFGGRVFDDSPRAIYEEVCRRKEFDGWRLIWAFAVPEQFTVPRGDKIKIDTFQFFHALLYSRVWICNSGMDRGIEMHRKRTVVVETWHGEPLKKICGEENQGSLSGKKRFSTKKPDSRTIRCSQSEYDRAIFARIFHADKRAILQSGLPRNDELFGYDEKKLVHIKKKLCIPDNKKVILYTPTYREYLVNEKKETYLAPPMDLQKWERKLGGQYVLLVRAHYAVSAEMNLKENEFVRDVSRYPHLNDLYVISDMMISDYSSTYFDYSNLKRPMFCFAYDLEEYEEKRGLYVDLTETLPCRIDSTEDQVIDSILTLDEKDAIRKANEFRARFAPYDGNASKAVVDVIISRISG